MDTSDYVFALSFQSTFRFQLSIDLYHQIFKHNMIAMFQVQTSKEQHVNAERES